MIVTIHQPNFFPHMGFFDKMRDADIFVILTHCQYEKNGYQNRFNMGDKWYTMSTNKGLEPIRNKRYLNPAEDWNRIKVNAQHEILDSFDNCISESLMHTNTEIISRIARILGITTRIVFDHATELKGTERLVDICKKYNAKTYLSGPSGAKYMDLGLFTEAGIAVHFQESKPSKPILECL